MDPNDVQITYFRQAAGTARFAYNWGLVEWEKQYAAWKINPTLPKPSDPALRKHLNAMKREAFPWMLKVSKSVVQEALRNLGVAYAHWFEDLKKPKKQRRFHHPKFHKKSKDRDRFQLPNDQVKVDGPRVYIPKLGWVRMREALRFDGPIQRVTVSRKADHWFISLTVETADSQPLPQTDRAGGLDLGLKDFVVTSDGIKVQLLARLILLEQRLRRLQRELSRKVKGSKNRAKAKIKLARCLEAIANVREDFLHQLSIQILRAYDIIGIEDLNVAGMMKNHRLARAIARSAWSKFKEFLRYKADWYGKTVREVDRFFPSSQLCSTPGCAYQYHDLTLDERTWHCPECGVVHDRDINAAINVRNAVSSTGSACGA